MGRHSHFVPSDTAGSRNETAVLLVGTAREFDIPQQDIRSTFNGYWITDALADVLYDEDDTEDKQETAKPSKSTKKASGNRAEKDSQKGNDT